ncbi:MAG: hypothetical protein GWP08_07820, partial [Nitrospiraceae bacterium]|nr:hypothetical protein [Nitrospiraceae bacterium]
LRDLNDASGADVRVRPLYLYVEVDDLWGDSTLRLGRQRIVEGAAYNRIDGLYFKQRHLVWDWYVFGGARATIYDDALSDLVLGGGVSYRPGRGTRLSLDAYYGEERRGGSDEVRRPFWYDLLGLSFPRRVDEDLDDWLVSLSVWQEVTPHLRVFGRLDLQDGSANELLLTATGYVPPWDLTYELSYRSQLNSLGDRVNDLTGFYRTLGVYEEYDNFLIALHKALSEKVAVSVEAEFHDAENDYWESANRDYNRYALIVSAQPLVKNVGATVALEKWDVGDGEGTWAVTGELTKSWDSVALTVGADYERYEDRITYYNAPLLPLTRLARSIIPGLYPGGYMPAVQIFDQWVVHTHEDIHSVYAKLRWNVCPDHEATAGITYEEDDGPDSPYWRVQAGYSIRF